MKQKPRKKNRHHVKKKDGGHFMLSMVVEWPQARNILRAGDSVSQGMTLRLNI